MTSTIHEQPAPEGIGRRLDYHSLNAELNLYAADGTIQFDKDRQAISCYLEQAIYPQMRLFTDPIQRLNYLIENGYYEESVFASYSEKDLRDLYRYAAGYGHHFASFAGAFKFYTSYALKSFAGTEILEDYTQRVCACALLLAQGNAHFARRLTEEILSGRFQPATPTFLNAGKAQRGELVSCFLLRVEDNLESIGRSVNSALQLSKRGGGVALLLTNLRESGAPIKRIENQASGVVPVMKILEDSFSYANQLGARQGAGAVYLHAHHPDILRFLDTKRENADEKIRIKTLSLGVVIPDITFELAKRDEPMCLFSPYDIFREYGTAMSDMSITDNYEQLCANPRISRTEISARQFFKTLAEIQFESGYPYVVFEDTANRANPLAGRINMSNLCSEILQVNTPSSFDEDLSYTTIGTDISCNLGSLNIAAMMKCENFGDAVADAVRALTAVSDLTSIRSVPSIRKANAAKHSIGLGQMNLHGYLASQRIHYGSEDALAFTDAYFRTITYHALKTSHQLAVERNTTFAGFAESKYADGSYFAPFIDEPWEPQTTRAAELFAAAQIALPTRDDWIKLRADIMVNGIYNAYLQAVPPTGSISYINNSTASIHPIAAKIEIRKEGKLGRIYYPAPHLGEDNQEYFADAYALGYEKIIDTYAVASRYVDQGLSLTLFFPDTATTRDINRAQIYAWKSGIKTLYYIRLRQPALAGTEIPGCVSCEL